MKIQTREISFHFSNNVANICSHWLKVWRSTEIKYIFMLCTYDILCKLSAIPHINSETNPLTLMINVVCKYLRQFLCTSFGVATLPICCNIKWWGRWLFITAKWNIPEFSEIFPGIVLVSIIYVRYCGFVSILPFLLGALWKKNYLL